MAEYITRDDAVAAACRVLAKFGGCTMGPFCPDSGCKEVREEFDNVPAADVVKVRHGRWVWDGGEDMHYYCSHCHHNAYGCTTEILDGKYRYCPSCGAIMDGGQNE